MHGCNVHKALYQNYMVILLNSFKNLFSTSIRGLSKNIVENRVLVILNGLYIHIRNICHKIPNQNRVV